MQRSHSLAYALAFVLIGSLFLTSCGRRRPPPPKAVPQPAPHAVTGATANLLPHIELPQAPQRLGTAVVILIDTSGSMDQTVKDHAGHQQAKFKIAQDALKKIVQFTQDWQSKHKDSPLYFGISSFSSQTSNVLAMGPFDAAKSLEAVSHIPRPGGGTAIGRALEAGFVSLYSTGCFRKHVICITDGNNTVGTPPNLVAQQLYLQTQGEVEMHFVAFDTSAKHFGFLKNTGGNVVEAADEKQLQDRLTETYEKRILVEAMPAEKE